MNRGRIAVVLVYEPATVRHKPVPLVRVENMLLAADVVRQAIAEAEARAPELAKADAVLGQVEHAEVNRLRDVLAALLPGFNAAQMASSPTII